MKYLVLPIVVLLLVSCTNSKTVSCYTCEWLSYETQMAILTGAVNGLDRYNREALIKNGVIENMPISYK